jgi:hypothetical protein
MYAAILKASFMPDCKLVKNEKIIHYMMKKLTITKDIQAF